ncbi:MAG: flagellar basal body P-ring formation chaperone FlgA [Gammaproteobacteria bacterium]
MNLYPIVIMVGLFFSSGLLASQQSVDWQSHSSIITTANAFLTEYLESMPDKKTEYALGKLDNRVKLKACPDPLEGYFPQEGRTSGNTTVGVRCTAGNGWSIYISAKIKVFSSILITTQPFVRGDRISSDDLTLVEKNISALPTGYYTDATHVAGMIARRSISANSILTPQMLKKPALVKRGESVTMMAESGPIKVRMTGEALSDGAKGDLIKIRTRGSKRIVDGTVMAKGVINVTL